MSGPRPWVAIIEIVQRIPILFFLAASATAQQPYHRLLEKLSDPVATRWEHFGPPYFSTNEKLLNRFYSRFDGVGGVTVGVSFQQNFSILVHARPQVCVIFDYNPGVTEILVPFFGQLLAENPTRREFLSTLLGAGITAEETRQMLEGRGTVNDVLTAVLQRTPPGKHKAVWITYATFCATAIWRRCPRRPRPISANRPSSGSTFWRTRSFSPERFSLTPSRPISWRTIPTAERSMAGSLSRENYALVRQYWMTGRIVGITGDIGGPGVARFAAYLRQLHLAVTVLYTSNVGSTVEGHFPETWFRDLYATLGQLPLTPDALSADCPGHQLYRSSDPAGGGTAVPRGLVGGLWRSDLSSPAPVAAER